MKNVGRTKSQATRFARIAVLLPCLAIVAALAMPLAAQAGTITGAAAMVGPGLGTAFVPAIINTVEGNDNDVDGQPDNLVVVVKRFDHDGYIDIEFLVRGSDPSGTTEYLFFESIDNNTGVNWIAHTMELGFNFGAAFTPSPADDGLDFDSPDFDGTPTSAAFSSVLLGQDKLVFSNGVHSTGSEVYMVRIDVPDGIETFTLRQYPTLVPEPSTLALAAAGIVSLAVMWRRRKQG